MKYIPISLTIIRVLLAPVIILLAVQQQHLIIVLIFWIAILTDVFDGIIARHLKISTPFLRRADTIADRIFWIAAVICIGILCPRFFNAHLQFIIIVIGIELSSHLMSFIRFGKEASTHNLLSKFWGILIVPAFSDVMFNCESNWLFNLCLLTGAIARFESLLIMAVIKKWDCDIPSIVHAFWLRQGKQIKRRKLLNS